MKRVLLSLIFGVSILCFPQYSRAGTNIHILPFKAWKQKKIDEAKSVVSELKRRAKRFSQVKEEDPQEDDIAGELSQAELNLGVVKELSANDYFLLYVSPQFKNNNEAFFQAAKALSPRDMADILAAYQKRLRAAEITSNVEAADSENEANFQEKTAKSP